MEGVPPIPSAGAGDYSGDYSSELGTGFSDRPHGDTLLDTALTAPVGEHGRDAEGERRPTTGPLGSSSGSGGTTSSGYGSGAGS